jgi:Kdo2-lipid IVA lauroyltransferase/acyltransferase
VNHELQQWHRTHRSRRAPAVIKRQLLFGWLRMTAMLPLPVAHALGVVLGLAGFALAGKSRRVAHRNLALCFPEIGPRERRRLLLATFIELGKQLAESGIIWQAGPGRLRRLVVNPSAVEELAAVQSAGKGLLLAAPHLGNWELCNRYLCLHQPVYSLYRPPRQSWLEPVLVQLRENLGGVSLPADRRGLRALLEALRRGCWAGILPDQVPRESSVRVPFFGHPALTMTLFGQVVAKTGADVALVFCERLSWGRGFRLHVLPGDPALHESDPALAARALNRQVETCVGRAPAQYQWTYRRFRAASDAHSDPYGNPDRHGRSEA